MPDPASLLPQDLDLPLRLCPMCGLGPSCVEHWLLLCPAVGFALTQHGGKLWSFSSLLPGSHSYLLKSLKAIAGTRRYLLTLGEIGKVAANSSYAALQQQLVEKDSPTSAAKILFHQNQLLAVLGRAEDPFVHHSLLPSSSADCPRLHTSGLLSEHPALLRALPTANKHKSIPVLTAKAPLLPGEEVACISRDSNPPYLLLP